MRGQGHEAKTSKVDSVRRLDWLDALRGLAIIFVVLGHTLNTPASLTTYVYTFHVPLFFFISGYLFNLARNNSFRGFLFKRFQRLIIPLFFFEFLAYILEDVAFRSPFKRPENVIYELFNGITNKEFAILNAPVWFLFTLFLVEIVYYLPVKWIRDKRILIGVMALVPLVESTYPHYYTAYLPWYVSTALYGLLFYCAGNLFRDFEGVFFKQNYLVFTLLFFTNFFYARNKVTFLDLKLGNYFIYYLSAFSAVLAYFYLFRKSYEKGFSSRPLEYFGKNTLIILGIHHIVFSIVDSNFYNIISVYGSTGFILAYFLLISLLLVLKDKSISLAQKIKAKVNKNQLRKARIAIAYAILFLFIIDSFDFYSHLWKMKDTGAYYDIELDWAYDYNGHDMSYWMPQTGAIDIYARKNTTIDLCSKIISAVGDRKVSVYYNNISLGVYRFTDQPIYQCFKNIFVAPGVNHLVFVANGPCVAKNGKCVSLEFKEMNMR
jgi:acyltransferase